MRKVQSSKDKRRAMFKAIFFIAKQQYEKELYVPILSIYEMEYGVCYAGNPRIASKAKLAIELIKS
ncbi:MAG: hypothetical protein KAI79_18300 [Bacteroidales bacterium]|nr:hypothetical protein [Bacteroidales bacterium]